MDYDIIIPTHNRPEKLKRLLDYIHSTNSEISIFVLDSSSEPLNEIMGPNVFYHWHQNMSFVDKVITACTLVDKEMVRLVADDDFPVFNNMHNEFSAEDGAYIGQVVCFNEPFDDRFYFLDRKPDFKVFGRAVDFLTDYRQILWGVYGRDYLKSCFELYNEILLSNDNWIEVFMGLYFSEVSSIKYSGEITIIREVTVSDHWAMRHTGLNSPVELSNDIRIITSLFSSSLGICSARIEIAILEFVATNKNKNGSKTRKIIKKILPAFILKSLRKVRRNDVSGTIPVLQEVKKWLK